MIGRPIGRTDCGPTPARAAAPGRELLVAVGIASGDEQPTTVPSNNAPANAVARYTAPLPATATV